MSERAVAHRRLRDFENAGIRRCVRHFRNHLGILALAAFALATIPTSAVRAQQPPPDLQKRVEFLEGALRSYQQQLAETNEKRATAEAINQVLSRQLEEASRALAAKQQPSPPDGKTK
jgi:hypothetical protein